MKKRDIIIVTVCIATALICIALTFWGNYKYNGVLSPDAFYGVLATFIGICATIIVGFQIASFVKINETERQIKEVQIERNKMQKEKEELYEEIKLIRKLLSRAFVVLSETSPEVHWKVISGMMSIITDYTLSNSTVTLSRYKYLVKMIEKSDPKSLPYTKVFDEFRKIDIPKNITDYTEIMKQHLKVIDFINEVMSKQETKE